MRAKEAGSRRSHQLLAGFVYPNLVAGDVAAIDSEGSSLLRINGTTTMVAAGASTQGNTYSIHEIVFWFDGRELFNEFITTANADPPVWQVEANDVFGNSMVLYIERSYILLNDRSS